MADQLWYTWARRGPTGRSGFQIVAASASLADRGDPATQAALRYCRAPGESADPAGSSPVSFGWADDGKWRVVFNRVPSGRDSIGRPGVFCAHVIVGRAAELPTWRIATWFGSPQWWTGTEGGWDSLESSQLAALRPEEFGAGDVAEPDEAQLSAFVEALLIRQSRRLTIPADPVQLASLAAGAERALPGIFEGTSLSTCEPHRQAGAFDVVGLAAATRGPYGSSRWDEHLGDDAAAGRVAHAIVVGTLPDRHRKLALSVATNGEGVDKKQFVITANALLAVESGAITAFADLPRALVGPQALGSILGRPAGLQLTSRALADDNNDAWEAMDQSAGGLPRPVLTDLGALLGTMVADHEHIVRLGGYLRRLQRLAPSMEHAAAAAVLNECAKQPLLHSRIDSDGRLQLLRHAHRLGADEAAQALIEHCGATDWPTIQAADLPPEWRGAVAARFVNAGRPASSLVGLLSTDEHLARAMLRDLASPAPLLTLARQCALDQARSIALFLGTCLMPSEGLVMMAAVSDRLPADRKVPFISKYLRLSRTNLSGWDDAEVARLASLAVAEAVIARAQNLRANVSPTSPEWTLLRSVGGPRHEAWTSINESIHKGANPADVVRGARSAFADFEPPEQLAAEEMALKAALTLCRTPDQVGEVAELLRGSSPHYGASGARLAVCAFRALHVERATMPAIAVLKHIAFLIAQKRIKTSSRAVSDGDLREILNQLVKYLPVDATNHVSESLETAPKAVKQWWMALIQPASGPVITVSLPGFLRHGQGRSSPGS